MTPTDKKEIVAYLSGPRNYAEGVALYDRYGHNRMYKRRFALEDTEFSRALLAEELRKLAGLSEAEFARLPRLAKTPSVVSAPVQESPKLQNTGANYADAALMEVAGKPKRADDRYEEAPEIVRKMIGFRERYPFLNSPDCPDILKILVNDMFAAYDAYKAAFAHLQIIPDETVAEAAEEAEKLVESYLTNREIWAELDHYRDTGEILGKAARFQKAEKAEPEEDLTTLSDMDLVKKLNSARANQSKQRAAVKQADAAGEDSATAMAALERWTEIRSRLDAEMDRRKKK